MSTYSYSVVSDCTAGVSPAQLKYELDMVSGIAPNVDHITRRGDDLDIIYDAALDAGEQTVLAGVIAAHTIDPNFDQAVTTIHVGSGQEFSSIAAAVAEFASNDLQGTIIVHPGTYYEVNPITIPPNVSLKAFGSSINTVVVALVPNENLFVLSDSSEIYGMGLNAGISSGVNGLYFDGSAGALTTCRDCLFSNLDSCCISDNGPGIFMVEEAIVVGTVPPETPVATTVNACFKAINGGDLRVFTTGCSGRAGGLPLGMGGYCAGKNSVTQLPSFLLLNSVNVQIASGGVTVDNGGRVELQGNIFRYTGIAITVGANGTDSDISANGVTILNSSVYDVNITCADAKNVTLTGMRIRRDLINDPNGVGPNISGFSEQTDDTGQILLGKLLVGSVGEPTSSQFGEGGSYNQNIVYYHNDNLEAGTWTDMNEVKTTNPSNTDIFVSSSAGNCFYIGGGTKFAGFNLRVSQLMDIGGGGIVYEYWNGTEWAELCIMVTWGSEPYYTLAQNLFRSDLALPGSGNRKFYVRFGKMPNWATKTMNALEKYWVRLRLTGTITTRPHVDRMKIQAHSQKINDSGATEYFGNARPIVRLDWDINTAKPANSSPGNADVYISDNLNVGRTENVFANNTVDRLGLNRYVPADMDTSIPLALIWSWTSNSNSGDIKWRIRWGSTIDGSRVYNNTSGAPSSFSNEESIDLIETVPATNYSQHTSCVAIDFCEATARPETGDLGHSHLLWVTVERRGGDSEDTCSGNVYMVNLTPHYTKWRSGAFLNMYQNVYT